jgi:diacylglycerol kinase family enzyme
VRALLVTNPGATSTTPGTRDVLIQALRSEVDLEVATTHRRGHAAELARQARLDGVEVVVALGGDGTVNELINGMLADGVSDKVPALAVVPGGSANVFARALGLPNDPIEATSVLLEALRERRTRSIGLGRANDRWFTFCAGLGLDAEIIRRVERARVRGRTATVALYVRSTFAQYLSGTDRSEPMIQLRRPGGAVVDGLSMVVVQNTVPWTYFGRYPVSFTDTASFDSGLDLFAMRGLHPGETAVAAAELLLMHKKPTGRATYRLRDQESFMVISRRPLALQLDGDYVGESDEIAFESHPDAVHVVL